MLWRLAALAVAFMLFAMAGAVVDPVIVRYRVPIAGLQEPVRVVHLTDIHASWQDMPPRRISRIVDMVNVQSPDLVLITGDMMGGKLLDKPHMAFETAIEPLAALKPRLAVVAVMGNHDNELWSPRVFARAGIPLLVGSWLDVGPLVIAGADSAAHLPPPINGLIHAIEAVPPGKPIISMSHEPETFQLVRGPTQLHFAGHSHGGQVMLPLIGGKPVNEFHDAHRRGLFRINGRWLLVSSGLGTSVLPIRIGVPPEIVVVELVPAHSVGRKSGTDR
ncbi:metallophosphoesterase [Polymorphobacter sp.]|uniref:metallophosphoesterase n=1 Tax=Polymorphobacter sp. TaxID=1909290 RepID=UPI003F6FBC87